ncbi:hypothetical protein WJX72_008676 [[Myrmecia] bisecta]|uniref:Uncharacterized protein n=1 Tax=[Myrmecia] bisecta TaxID=41462 RepID=A0AAW1R8G8_9CHLO
MKKRRNFTALPASLSGLSGSQAVLSPLPTRPDVQPGIINMSQNRAVYDPRATNAIAQGGSTVSQHNTQFNIQQHNTQNNTQVNNHYKQTNDTTKTFCDKIPVGTPLTAATPETLQACLPSLSTAPGCKLRLQHNPGSLPFNPFQRASRHPPPTSPRPRQKKKNVSLDTLLEDLRKTPGRACRLWDTLVFANKLWLKWADQIRDDNCFFLINASENDTFGGHEGLTTAKALRVAVSGQLPYYKDLSSARPKSPLKRLWYSGEGVDLQAWIAEPGAYYEGDLTLQARGPDASSTTPTQNFVVPDQSDKVFLITGANAGIGYQAAKELVASNAHVFIASRTPDRCRKAVESIRASTTGAGKIDWLQCDLTSFRSIYECAERFKARKMPLHVLMNNAGTENPPDDGKTEDNFDVTMATNYFGHWYLTHLLLDNLRGSASPATPARVVFTASLSEAHGDLTWDDLKGEKHGRSDYAMYAMSKVATLMFCRELQRRMAASSANIDCFACHPGVAMTDAFRKSDKTKLTANILNFAKEIIGQSEEKGAIPMLHCATAENLTGQGAAANYGHPYYALPWPWFGPSGAVLNIDNTYAGKPQNKLVADADACARLYEETEKLVNTYAPVTVNPAQLASMGVRG